MQDGKNTCNPDIEFAGGFLDWLSFKYCCGDPKSVGAVAIFLAPLAATRSQLDAGAGERALDRSNAHIECRSEFPLGLSRFISTLQFEAGNLDHRGALRKISATMGSHRIAPAMRTSVPFMRTTRSAATEEGSAEAR